MAGEHCTGICLLDKTDHSHILGWFAWKLNLSKDTYYIGIYNYLE